MVKNILVVDDDDEIRDLLEFDVAQSGYFVDTAKDGMEGLNKALNNTYDLILLDVMMPKMNGIETLENLKNIVGFKMPVVALTADVISGMEEKYIKERKLKAELWIDDRNLGGLPDWGTIYRMIHDNLTFNDLMNQYAKEYEPRSQIGFFRRFFKNNT